MTSETDFSEALANQGASWLDNKPVYGTSVQAISDTATLPENIMRKARAMLFETLDIYLNDPLNPTMRDEVIKYLDVIRTLHYDFSRKAK